MWYTWVDIGALYLLYVSEINNIQFNLTTRKIAHRFVDLYDTTLVLFNEMSF